MKEFSRRSLLKAGAQRTDKKVVDAKQSMGGSAPQGDALLVTNHLRIVRSLNNG